MSVSRVAAWVFGAAVVGAWFASAAGVARPARHPRPPQRPVESAAIEHLASQVQAQAGRLRKRLENAPAPGAAYRNPFEFSPRATPAARRVRSVPPPAPAPPPVIVPAEPPFQLIGIAEKKVGDGVLRTAMLVAGDAENLIMATPGQRILGAYEVVAIGGDAVELKDLASGASHRLILK